MSSRWWALGALVASLLVLGFDLTILNVALPTLAAELGASTGEQQWMADAYVVVFAALMLPGGLLGDRFGRRRLLIAGLGLFLVGSVIGSLAPDVGTVIAARALMGAGGALVMPLSLAVIPSLFSSPGDRTRAVGLVSAASALGLPLGPIAGGWLLEHFWWGSIFLINIPMAAIGMTACALLLPESRDSAAPPVDTVSAALTAGGLGSLVYGVIEGPTRGWTDPWVLAMLTAGAVLVSALILRERRATRPMLDLSLLGDRAFLLPTLTTTMVMLVMAGLLFTVPIHLQTVLGYDPLETGIRLLPMMGGLVIAAQCGAPLARRAGRRVLITTGLVVLAFAALLGSRTTLDHGYGFTALWLSIMGLGFGFAVVPAMDAAIAALPAARAGSGSALLMTVRQMGNAIGIALLGALLASVYVDRLETSGLPPEAAATAEESVVAAHVVAERLGDPALAEAADSAFLHGMTSALLVCGAVALLTALLMGALLPRREPETEAQGSSAAETAHAPQ
ncbi:DHA2 family efflux MFS transporter permease subunit [Streptomyces albipurpureus]|uniref:DHA2 family efflux MFS transporter permease subunit n=1 Tax=Streptomyces albipurpureus TaxID=2897419 RepID=A0ABT0UL32_9ACTN|nr:DHA2 family efflux MFS transporter permease subunit [Streptomyces sp. CWNU-1]MCM2389223.1 DHA2 family efflux MFS transporter permease subunit [Streptomyces sp. CWNU-1]